MYYTSDFVGDKRSYTPLVWEEQTGLGHPRGRSSENSFGGPDSYESPAGCRRCLKWRRAWREVGRDVLVWDERDCSVGRDVQ